MQLMKFKLAYNISINYIQQHLLPIVYANYYVNFAEQVYYQIISNG